MLIAGIYWNKPILYLLIMANVRIIVLSQFNAFAAKQNFGQHIINHAGYRKLLRVNETRNFSHANRTQTSLCSASYVNWQRGAAHIRLSHAGCCWPWSNRSISRALRAHSSKPAAAAGRDRQTDGRTQDSFIDPAPHYYADSMLRQKQIKLLQKNTWIVLSCLYSPQ